MTEFGDSHGIGSDGVNRLDLASEGAAWSQDYVYDAFGNRKLSTDAFAFDSSNRISTAGGASYDLAGNLLAFGGVADSMAYDAENRKVGDRLLLWRKRDGSQARLRWSGWDGKMGTYVYDGDARRIKRA